MCDDQIKVGHVIYHKSGAVTVDIVELFKSENVKKQIEEVRKIREFINNNRKYTP